MKAIIFDMDGVLVDSEPLDMESWETVLGEYGIYVSRNELICLVGKPAESVIEHFMHNIDQRHREQILSDKQAIFYELARARLTPMPGVASFIRRLWEQKVLMGVASSSSHQRILFSLSHTDLLPYFKAVCSGDEVARPKPAPDVFIRAASRLNVAPESCVALEDSIHGVTASQQAGMVVYGYTSSFPAETLRKAGATFTFDSFAFLEDHLEINGGDYRLVL